MFKQLLSVFLESRCPLCDRPNSEIVCSYCQKKLNSYKLTQPDRFWQGDLPLFAWGRYDGELKRAIAKLKYDSRSEIGSVLGRWLGQSWQNKNIISQQKLSVVPIPLHSQRLKTRGYNQALLIAKGFCQVTGYLLHPQSLIRTQNTRAMYELNFQERTENLTNAFMAGDRLPKHPVLLLDDIYTSGTTVREATTVLKKHNIKVAGVVVSALATKFNN